jgi:hypothetical protein
MITLTVFKTQVRIRPVILINVLGLWALATWVGLYRDPQRGLLLGLVVGFIAAFLLLVADIGHAVAHIFSARYAGAPMDLILLSAGMPRTLYFDDDVPPRVHRLRALGGPIFSALGLLLSAAAYALFSRNPIGWELAVWSLIGHGGILAGSLLPLPVVDGGVLLKWTLVARGRTAAQADEAMRRVDWGLGVLGAALGLWLMAAGLWIAGVIALGVGGVAIAVAAGWLR